MPPNRTALTCTSIATLGLVGSAALVAGPLSPPAGPVSSTYKTLAEVEPRVAINAANTPGDANSVYRIAKPGSYYLTGNIDGTVGKAVVLEIAASDVSVDMNGFTLDGKDLNIIGMRADQEGFPDRLTIRNGNIRGCSIGIYFVHSQVQGNLNVIEHVRAHENGTGFSMSSGCLLRHCSAWFNDDDGFVIASGILESCFAYVNGGTGFQASGRIADCIAGSNGAWGIVFGTGAMTGCSTSGNSGGGAQASGAVVEGCRFSDGVTIVDRCIVRGNNCSRTGNTAMLVSGTDNRIEANNFTNSSIGLGVTQPGNVIIRNIASGNGLNWTVVAGNALAPVVQAATNPSNFNGSVYAGSLGSIDPNANFSF